MELWSVSSNYNVKNPVCVYYTGKADGNIGVKTLGCTPLYSFSTILYSLSVFGLLTFGHLEKIAIGFGIR